MAIAYSTYIQITSGVGGVAQVPRRDLIGRLITTNPLMPKGESLDFSELSDVLDFFGASSEEYARALFYFGFISKNIKKAQSISFAGWADVDTAPLIFGDKSLKALADYTPISDGSFRLTMGALTLDITGIDFTGAASLSDVASLVQAAIQGVVGGDTNFVGSSVTYDAVRGSFNLVGGDMAAAVIDTDVAASGTDILSLLGWNNPGTPTTTSAIFSNGASAQTPVEVFDQTRQLSNNFASFVFLDTLSLQEYTDVSAANAALNNTFIFCVPVLLVDQGAYFAAMENNGGTAITLIADAITPAEYDEMVPMIVLAATDYESRNAVQNYMFQQLNLTPKVTETSEASVLAANRINFYGQTQSAGQFLSFYQRGFLMGQAVDAVDMGPYSNEIWLKDAAGAELGSLLLALPQLPGNASGASIVVGTLRSTVIEEALFNGVISVGRILNNTQRVFIENQTGDPNAWYQVQNAGYWLDAEVQENDNNGVIETCINYTLIYAQATSVRKIKGTHTLI